MLIFLESGYSVSCLLDLILFVFSNDLIGGSFIWRIKISSFSLVCFLQESSGPAGHLGPLFYYHHDDKHSGFQSNKLSDSHSSVPATKSGFSCKVC